MNRPPWYRLAGHIGARNSSRSNPAVAGTNFLWATGKTVETWRSGSGLCGGGYYSANVMVRRVLLAPNTRGVACKWDENVSILSVSPAKAQVTRPSDALFGKLIMRTATDWVTRGHLTLYGRWLNVQSGQCKAQALPSIAGRQSEGLKRTLARISQVLLYCCVADGETFGSQQQTVGQHGKDRSLAGA
jgi:hypothetical protein